MYGPAVQQSPVHPLPRPLFLCVTQSDPRVTPEQPYEVLVRSKRIKKINLSNLAVFKLLFQLLQISESQTVPVPLCC